MKANINGRYKKRGKSLTKSEKQTVETVAKALFANPVMFFGIGGNYALPK
jgi:hypothetical protein